MSRLSDSFRTLYFNSLYKHRLSGFVLAVIIDCLGYSYGILSVLPLDALLLLLLVVEVVLLLLPAFYQPPLRVSDFTSSLSS